MRRRAAGATDEPAAAPEPSPASDRDALRRRVEARLEEGVRRRELRPATAPAPGPGSAPEPADEESAPDRHPAPDSSTPGDDPWTSGPDHSARPAPAWPRAPRPRSLIAELIATCFFLGRIPVAPGTFGALAGLAAFALTRGFSGPVQLALVAAAAVVGVWASHRYASDLRSSDPQSVVVDEFVGMWLALVALDPGLVAIAAAFVGFRVLDIFKPPPVSWAERLPGGFGIMADDLAAGTIVRAAFWLIL